MSESPKTDRSFPHAPIAAAGLRDQASPTRVAAVWSRLEAGLPSAGARAVGHSWLGARALWVSALVTGAFALGVAVGANGLSPRVQRADVELALQAEPRVATGSNVVADSTRAAGAPQVSQRASEHNAKARPVKQNAESSLGAAVDPTLGEGSVTQEVVEGPAPAPVTPLWQLAAQQGEYQTALSDLEAGGGFEAAVAQADADQLMMLADVARATGFRQRALLAWRRVINQHASDPQAPLAAWSLGNMLEKAGDQAGAADAFAAYRALSPQGDFAEDALARQIRMAVTQQDAQLANRLAAQYDQSFPNGQRAQEIRQQLAKLRRESSSASGSDADAGVESEPAHAPK